MQEILKKLVELIGHCEIRLIKLEREKSELAGFRSTLNSQKENQDSREKDIQVQTTVLDKKKMTVKTLEEANSIFKKAEENRKNLKSEIDKFENQKSDHLKKMKEDRDDIARQKEKLSEQSIEIDKKAKNYKTEVMDQILKNPIVVQR